MTPYRSNTVLSGALMLMSDAQDGLRFRCCCRT
jgi:hypothetical protein